MEIGSFDDRGGGSRVNVLRSALNVDPSGILHRQHRVGRLVMCVKGKDRGRKAPPKLWWENIDHDQDAYSVQIAKT